MGLFCSEQAFALYRDSLGTAFGEEQHWGVEVLYQVEAASDGDPLLNFEEAKRAHGRIQECAHDWGVSFFGPSCLKGKFLSRFAMDTGEYAALAEENQSELFDNLKATRDPTLIAMLWKETEDSPRLRYLIFSHPNANRWLKLLGSTRWTPENFADLRPTLDNMQSTLDSHEKWVWPMELEEAAPEETLRAQLEQESKAFAEMARLIEEGMAYDAAVAKGDAITRADVDRLIDSGNRFAIPEVIAATVERQGDPSQLMEWASKNSDLNVVQKSFYALASYRDNRVSDFLLRQLLSGSFNVSLLVQSLLPYSRDREYLLARLQRTEREGDAYERLVAQKAIRSLQGQTDLGTDPKFIFQVIPEMLGVVEHMRGVSDARTFTTAFFRFPRQLPWVAEELKRWAHGKGRSEKISVVLTGASYGPETYSLLFFLDADYRRDPGAWNHVPPSQRITLYSTDIDEMVLAYARRGRFVRHPCQRYSDVAFRGEWERYIGDPSAYFDVGDDEGVYRVKAAWRSLPVFETLNILDTAPFVARHGRPDGVLFNLVDGHLGSEENERKAAEELSSLATDFVAATFRKETAPAVFAERMDRVRSSGPTHLYRSRGR